MNGKNPCDDARSPQESAQGPVRCAIGLMSGTSMDAVDAALIETDGRSFVRPLGFLSRPWAEEDRALLRLAMARALEMDCPGSDPLIDRAARRVDEAHIEAVKALLEQARIDAGRVRALGYHGQTVAHRPERGWTWQIGQGARLRDALGMTVVSDFRSADMAAGGQGAPLLPIYHRALCADLALPVAVVNLGGVGNISYVGQDGTLRAFDTGPGNALIDDFVRVRLGLPFDRDGAMARSGQVRQGALKALIDHPWFRQPPPKSLDRAAFDPTPVAGLSDQDGAATLVAFTAASIGRALDHVPDRPLRLLVAGGGRHNPALMQAIAQATGIAAEPIEAIGANGDATEAEGFAYMAIRALDGLPISFPGTTGVCAPMTGGRIFRPHADRASEPGHGC